MLESMSQKDALDILGLPDKFSEEELKNSYYKQSKNCHPDSGGTNGLFRIVSKAYSILKSSNSSPRNESKGEDTKDVSYQKAKSRTWKEIVSDPKFVIPFETFLNVAIDGIPQHVMFENYDVTIKPRDLFYEYIRTEYLCNVTITSWKSVFHKWLHLKPNLQEEKRMRFHNEKELFARSIQVVACPIISCNGPGYHELTGVVAGRRFLLKAKTKQAYDSASEEWSTVLKGCLDINISISMRFIQK